MSDIYDQADNAVETKPEYSTWGLCALDMFEAVWLKGTSAPERFDPTIHKPADRFVRVEIVIIPLDEMNAKYNAEFRGNATGWNNRDWAAVVLPSIKALGVSARNLPNQYVKVTKRPNGKFYTKKDKTTGQPLIGVDGKPAQSELSDFLFVKLFKSQDECLADYLETKAGDPVSQASADAFPAGDPAPVAAAPAAAPADAILVKFAQALVTGAAKQAPGDLAQITELVRLQIEKNPMLAGKYTVDAEPVVSMLIAAVA